MSDSFDPASTLVDDLLGGADLALESSEQRLELGALQAASEDLARRLTGAGVQPGDRVAVSSPDPLQEAVAWLGAWRAGAVVLPLHRQWTAAQVQHGLARTDTRCLLGDHPAAPAELPRLPADGPTAPLPPPPAADDLAAIFPTSGSTGPPKGVQHSHGALRACAASVVDYLALGPDDRLLAMLPLAFHYGLSQLSAALVAGATLAFPRAHLPLELLRDLDGLRISVLATVPAGWRSLLAVQQQAALELPALRMLTCAGGGLDAATCRALGAAFPGARLCLMYGFTEALRATWLPPELLADKAGALGVAVPGAQLAVVDPDTGMPAEQGELVQAGSFLSPGYWQDPDATAARFRPCPALGGQRAAWSGDLVRRDADGLLWFVGRRDHLIKSQGFRIGPTEVETGLRATGLVQDAVVVGLPLPDGDQAVAALVVPAAGFSAGAMRRACRALLPRYMIPSRVVETADLPRTATGKPDRAAVLRQLSPP